MEYTYIDGCNNKYTLQVDARTGEAQFEYRPITPDESSSGDYDGGEPVQGQLAKPLVDRFVQAFDQLQANVAKLPSPPPLRQGHKSVPSKAEESDVKKEGRNKERACPNTALAKWYRAASTKTSCPRRNKKRSTQTRTRTPTTATT
jgi:hypothetical protein